MFALTSIACAVSIFLQVPHGDGLATKAEKERVVRGLTLYDCRIRATARTHNLFLPSAELKSSGALTRLKATLDHLFVASANDGNRVSSPPALREDYLTRVLRGRAAATGSTTGPVTSIKRAKSYYRFAKDGSRCFFLQFAPGADRSKRIPRSQDVHRVVLQLSLRQITYIRPQVIQDERDNKRYMYGIAFLTLPMPLTADYLNRVLTVPWKCLAATAGHARYTINLGRRTLLFQIASKPIIAPQWCLLRREDGSLTYTGFCQRESDGGSLYLGEIMRVDLPARGACQVRFTALEQVAFDLDDCDFAIPVTPGTRCFDRYRSRPYKRYDWPMTTWPPEIVKVLRLSTTKRRVP